VCGPPRLCRRRERRLIGARFGRRRGERFGRARCLTLRYSLLLSVWVDPSAEHIVYFPLLGAGHLGRHARAPHLESARAYVYVFCSRRWVFTRVGGVFGGGVGVSLLCIFLF